MTDYERTARRSDGGQRQDRGIAYDSEERETRSTSDDRPCCIIRKRTGNSDIRVNVQMQRKIVSSAGN